MDNMIWFASRTCDEQHSINVANKNIDVSSKTNFGAVFNQQVYNTIDEGSLNNINSSTITAESSSSGKHNSGGANADDNGGSNTVGGGGSPNREYKASLFQVIFTNVEALADLYKSLQPDSTIKSTDIEILKLDNALIRDYYNDIGFRVDDRLIVLIEEQSTICNNMPLRILLYISRFYERYIKEHNLNIYGTKLVEIPAPEFYVISTKDCKEKYLKLSDAFYTPDSSYLELKVPIITEEEHFEESSLKSYLDFVHKVEYNYKKGDYIGDLRGAIQAALLEINSNTIADQLIKKEGIAMETLFEEKFSYEDFLNNQITSAARTAALEAYVTTYIEDGRSDEEIIAYVQYKGYTVTEIERQITLLKRKGNYSKDL